MKNYPSNVEILTEVISFDETSTKIDAELI